MKKIISIILALFAISAYANDGVYYTAGNQLIPLQETTISVKKEILTISLNDEYMAQVDVYYEFNNPSSESKSVVMGFEANRPYNPNETKFDPSGVHPYIYNFSVEINGESLKYKNGLFRTSPRSLSDRIDINKYSYDEEEDAFFVTDDVTGNAEERDYSYVYYFKATFRPGMNKIHHTYSYNMSMVVGQSFILEYKLSPATRWANKQIDDFTLIVRADNTAKHFMISDDLSATDYKVIEGVGKIRRNDIHTEVSLRNGAIKCHKTNFKPSTKELTISSADINYTFDDTKKFGSFYDRGNAMGLYFWSNFEEGSRMKAMGTALFKRIAKNLPYANRGHIFKDATLKKYFESLWWYMPDPTYNDDTSGFTKSDWEYVNAGK